MKTLMMTLMMTCCGASAVLACPGNGEGHDKCSCGDTCECGDTCDCEKNCQCGDK